MRMSIFSASSCRKQRARSCWRSRSRAPAQSAKSARHLRPSLRGGSAVLVATDPFLAAQRHHIIALAARYVIPVMHEQREYPLAGGLMSYGASLGDALRQGGIYVGRILKGQRPADLPVVQSSKFDFVINLRTAQALGLKIPLGI